MSANVLNTVVSKKNVSELEAGTVQLNIARVDGAKGKSDRCLITTAVSAAFVQNLMLEENGLAWITAKIDELRGKLATAATGSQFGKIIDASKVFGLEAMLAAMAADTTTQRMTKESVAAWFDADLRGLVYDAVVAKLAERGIGKPSDNKLKAIADQYQAGFVRLCEREPKFMAQELEQLNKAIALLPDDYDSVIGSKVADKLLATKPAQIEDAL